METVYWSTIYQIPTCFRLKRVIKITKPTAIEKRKVYEIGTLIQLRNTVPDYTASTGT